MKVPSPHPEPKAAEPHDQTDAIGRSQINGHDHRMGAPASFHHLHRPLPSSRLLAAGRKQPAQTQSVQLTRSPPSDRSAKFASSRLPGALSSPISPSHPAHANFEPRSISCSAETHVACSVLLLLEAVACDGTRSLGLALELLLFAVLLLNAFVCSCVGGNAGDL